MSKRHGRFGAFLGCSQFPKCKGKGNLPPGDEQIGQEQQTESLARLAKAFEFIRECGGVAKAYQWLKAAETAISATNAGGREE